ncbi:hypothetical protein PanWU01x14_038400 [Parasponia andersonii]|uniref:Uncharacterized protein n=1 Tax=Parasponia andersonii TaxID=3476 RepID=A0A2P5DRJ0_PARAD|nr:hypothetical protein PanWU01x14_038400 [Parasponia andersonii]
MGIGHQQLSSNSSNITSHVLLLVTRERKTEVTGVDPNCRETGRVFGSNGYVIWLDQLLTAGSGSDLLVMRTGNRPRAKMTRV